MITKNAEGKSMHIKGKKEIFDRDIDSILSSATYLCIIPSTGMMLHFSAEIS